MTKVYITDIEKGTYHQAINLAKKYTEAQLSGDNSGHDIWHVRRVVGLAKLIAQKEGCSQMLEIELLAWLHDALDSKLVEHKLSAQEALKTTFSNLFTEPAIHNLIGQILSIGYRVRKPAVKNSLVVDIVNDADQIDAIGAIGVARCFTYGAFKQQAIYHPNINEQHLQLTSEQPSSFKHFYDKLIRIKDGLKTFSARKMAEERHTFIMHFMQEFEKENQVLKNLI